MSAASQHAAGRVERLRPRIHADSPAINAAFARAVHAVAAAPDPGPAALVAALAAGQHEAPLDWLDGRLPGLIARAQDIAPDELALTLLAAARCHAWTGAGWPAAMLPALRAAALHLAQTYQVVQNGMGGGGEAPREPVREAVPGPAEARREHAGEGRPGASGNRRDRARQALAEAVDALRDAGDVAGALALGREATALERSSPLDVRAGDAARLARDRLAAACRAGDADTAGRLLVEAAAELAAGTDPRPAESGGPGPARPEAAPPGHTGRAPGTGAAPPDTLERAARFVLAVVHDFFGARPDAFRHRLTLRPLLPPGWRSLALRGLRLGDAALDLDIANPGGRLSYHLVQTEGAVPIRVVVEAYVGRAPARTVVDGREARLDGRDVAGGRHLVGVQLDLAEPRTLELVD